MKIQTLFTQSEAAAPVLGRGSVSLGATLIGATLLASIPGSCLAQSSSGITAFLPSPVVTVSTIPPNGDVNPYGVAFVPKNFQAGSGPLKPGDILVSNFNNSANIQGTGTTIVSISPNGKQSLFFQGAAPLGLSTALGTLARGFVVVGNSPDLPSTQTAGGAGSLLVINNQGKLIQTITGLRIRAPWDMALVDLDDRAIAFISDALTGTISRLDFRVTATGLTLLDSFTIASGYVSRPDPVTFFVAPTGLVFDASDDRLYVASTGNNAVFEIDDASTRQSNARMGTIIYADPLHLHGALAMAEAPNGHLLVTNNDGINSDPTQPSEIVEFTKQGEFVKEIPVDPAQGGSFGLAVSFTSNQFILAAVDDNTSSLIIWTLNSD